VTLGDDNGTDGQTDRQTDRQSATQYAAPPKEEGRIIISVNCMSISQLQNTIYCCQYIKNIIDIER